MTFEEIAEDYIIQRYGINKNYRVDDEKTRSYMKIFVHSEYQQEYECYLAGLEERDKELEAFRNGEVVCIKHYEAIKLYPELKKAFEELKKENERLNSALEKL